MRFFHVVDENGAHLNIGSIARGKNAKGSYWLAIGTIANYPDGICYYNFETEMARNLAYDSIVSNPDELTEISGYMSKKMSKR
jgi:hypothetical protein